MGRIEPVKALPSNCFVLDSVDRLVAPAKSLIPTCFATAKAALSLGRLAARGPMQYKSDRRAQRAPPGLQLCKIGVSGSAMAWTLMIRIIKAQSILGPQ